MGLMMQSKTFNNKHKLEFEAIGTNWTIEADLDSSLAATIAKIIDDFDRVYSRFRSDSLVTKMSQKTGEYRLPSDAKTLFDFYKQLYKISNGLVTPLIGGLMEDAGYDANYSLVSKDSFRQTPSWEDALEYKFPQLTIKQPIMLDFGAAGKGYLVDIIGSILQHHGIQYFCINAGGDMLIKDSHQRVALENPYDSSQAIGIVDIKNDAICGSAGNRRKWGKLHHTINPKTQKSPARIDAIWVRAKTAMLADGISTALYFVEPEKLSQLFEFEYAMIVDKDIQFSKNFNAEFFR